jgi:hypothetical protein
MAPAKGNKHAVGHGRPHIEGWDNDAVIALGEELLKWMKECDEGVHDMPVHLSDFYFDIKDMFIHEWKCILQRECFLPYYEKAKLWLSKKILLNKDIQQSYGNRFIGMYNRELHDYEEAKADRQAERAQGIKAQDAQNFADLLKEAVKGEIKQKD